MIKQILKNNKPAIVEDWIDAIFETYPPETSRFLKQQKDKFSNPVGFTISNCAERIFDEIINDNNPDVINCSLNDLIKIRAVQQFSPSSAAGFMFLLKKIIIRKLNNILKNTESLNEFFEIETRIDDAALAAFDLYSEAREKVFQIRVNEIKLNSGNYKKGKPG